MGNIAKERESMEQADYPSYTLDALRARKETATIGNADSAPSGRERQSPDWRSEFRNLAFQSQLTRCHVSSPIGPIQRSILDGPAQVPRLDVRSAIQVRDGARHLPDAIMRPRGKPQP